MEGGWPTELKIEAEDFWGGSFLLRRPMRQMTVMVKRMPMTMPATRPMATAAPGIFEHCGFVSAEPGIAEAVGDADVDLGVDDEEVALPVLEWLAVLEGFDDVDEEACMTQLLFWQE